MEYTFKVFCVILGLIGTMENGLCITEDEVNEFVEKKLEEVIQKYDRKIALLGKKIRAQDVKIRNLEKKCATSTSDAGKKKEMETAPLQLFASNRDNDTNIQINRQAERSHKKEKRIVQGKSIVLDKRTYILDNNANNSISYSIEHAPFTSLLQKLK